MRNEHVCCGVPEGANNFASPHRRRRLEMADSHLLRPLLEGAVLQKYDYGRSRRSPKFVMLSADLRRLRWRPASAELPVAPRPPPLRARAAASTTSTRWRPSINAATQARGSGGGIRRSLSFGAQRWSSAELSCRERRPVRRHASAHGRSEVAVRVAADGCADIRLCARERVAGRRVGARPAARGRVGAAGAPPAVCWAAVERRPAVLAARAAQAAARGESHRPDACRCTAQCRALRHGGRARARLCGDTNTGGVARPRGATAVPPAGRRDECAPQPCCARPRCRGHPCRPPNRGRRPRPPSRRRATLDAAASSRRWKRATTLVRDEDAGFDGRV